MTKLLTPTASDGWTASDRAALDRMHVVDPVWSGMALARDVIPFGPRTILHAGPPVTHASLSVPLLNSAAVAAVFEGWASSFAAAVAMIGGGEIELAPAQDRSAMVPLAAVLSPTMAVQAVRDRNNPTNVAYSPINGGGPTAARFGLSGERALAHLRWINGNLAATLAIVADRDVSLLTIADLALGNGDDCHGKTVHASAQIVEALAPRLGIDTPERRFLDAAPGFFLALWMAAAKCMARAGEGAGSSIVTAAGGNGSDFGVQIGGVAGRWFTVAAAPPDGVLDAGFSPSDRLGAIGDSAIVDMLGFGAMLSQPEMAQDGLLSHRHVAFRSRPTFVGLAARRAVKIDPGLRVSLGILDRQGEHGRIGGGFYAPPVEVFRKAVAGLV